MRPMLVMVLPRASVKKACEAVFNAAGAKLSVFKLIIPSVLGQGRCPDPERN